MTKKVILVLVVIVMLISVGLNLYHYGYQYVFKKGFNAGINTVSNSVAQQYKDTGRISMTMDGKTLFFEPVRTSARSGSIPKTDNVDEMFK